MARRPSASSYEDGGLLELLTQNADAGDDGSTGTNHFSYWDLDGADGEIPDVSGAQDDVDFEEPIFKGLHPNRLGF
jgi:hypothetical protein